MNIVIETGRLTDKPELKTTPSGKMVTSFTIAVNEGWGDKAVTFFFDCVAWDKQAEFITKYFGKGDAILISGRLQTRNWEDKNGSKRKSTEVVVTKAEFFAKKTATPNKPAEDNPYIGEQFAPIEDEDMPF